MSDNLPVLLAQDRLMQEIGYGKLSMEFTIHNGKARSARVFGSQRYLYNRSPNDTQNNEKAASDILSRIKDAIDRQADEELVFHTVISKGKVVRIEWDSTQDKRFDTKK